MKIRLCYSMFIFLLFSGICPAQGPPTPAREGSLGSPEVSVDLLLPVKDATLSHYGVGGQVTATHYFSYFRDRVGVQVEGDYLRTHGYNFHDAGVRVGPTIRFSTRHLIQPYARALFGYAQIKDQFLAPQTSYHGGASLLAGAGLEFPISGRLFGKVGADLEYDWTKTPTRLGRGLVGVAYQFGQR